MGISKNLVIIEPGIRKIVLNPLFKNEKSWGRIR